MVRAESRDLSQSLVLRRLCVWYLHGRAARWARHPGEASAEAADAEQAVGGQAAHEDLQCTLRCIHAAGTAHASTTVHDEHEMEIGARRELSHIGLFVVKDLQVLLRRRWLKRGHEGGHAGHLAGFRVLGVQQVRLHHVASAPVEVDLAAALPAPHLNKCAVLARVGDFGALGHAQVGYLGLACNGHLVAEFVRVCLPGLLGLETAVVWVEAHRKLEVVGALQDLQLVDQLEPEPERLLRQQVAKSDAHDLFLFRVTLGQQGSVPSCDGVVVSLGRLCLVTNLRLDRLPVELSRELGQHGVLLGVELVGSLKCAVGGWVGVDQV